MGKLQNRYIRLVINLLHFSYNWNQRAYREMSLSVSLSFESYESVRQADNEILIFVFLDSRPSVTNF